MKSLKQIRKWATIFVLAIVSAGMIGSLGEGSEYEKSKHKKEVS